MRDETKAEYRRLAAHFYATRLGGAENVTPKRLADALLAAAPEYRPAYWRRLRGALAFDQAERGYTDAADRLRRLKNPVTRPGAEVERKPKQRRVRRVEQSDERRLLAAVRERGDRELSAALTLARHLGLRPAEMSRVTVEAGRAHVEGAKKSHGGQRGADRVIELPPEHVAEIEHAAQILRSVDIGPVQDRLRRLAHRLWPQRRALPTLYTWRHQLGSDLKASGMDRREIAYIMGHQSTASVDVYGSRRSASRGGRQLPRAPEGTQLDGVRVRHEAPFSQQAKAPPLSPLMDQLARHGVGGMRLNLNVNPDRRANFVNSLREKSSGVKQISRDHGLKPR